MFGQVHLRGIFRPLVGTETVFRSLEEWSSLTCLPPAWNGCTILASGKGDFINAVLPKLSTHVGPLLYSLDMALSDHCPRLVQGLYSSWGHKWSIAYGLSSVVLAHAAFGGVSLAIHLISYRGVHASCFVPQGALAQTLGHIINPASDTRGQNIKPPMALQPPVPRSPIVQDGLLRGKGLFYVFPA